MIYCIHNYVKLVSGSSPSVEFVPRPTIPVDLAAVIPAIYVVTATSTRVLLLLLLLIIRAARRNAMGAIQ